MILLSSPRPSLRIPVMKCHPAIERNSLLNTQNTARSKKYARQKKTRQKENVSHGSAPTKFQKTQLVTLTGHGLPGRQYGNGRVTPPKVEGYCEQFGVLIVAMASGVYTNIKIITLCILNVHR